MAKKTRKPRQPKRLTKDFRPVFSKPEPEKSTTDIKMSREGEPEFIRILKETIVESVEHTPSKTTVGTMGAEAMMGREAKESSSFLRPPRDEDPLSSIHAHLEDVEMPISWLETLEKSPPGSVLHHTIEDGTSQLSINGKRIKRSERVAALTSTVIPSRIDGLKLLGLELTRVGEQQFKKLVSNDPKSELKDIVFRAIEYAIPVWEESEELDEPQIAVIPLSASMAINKNPFGGKPKDKNVWFTSWVAVGIQYHPRYNLLRISLPNGEELELVNVGISYETSLWDENLHSPSIDPDADLREAILTAVGNYILTVEDILAMREIGSNSESRKHFAKRFWEEVGGVDNFESHITVTLASATSDGFDPDLSKARR